MATWTPHPSFYPSPRMAMRENRAQRRSAFVSASPKPGFGSAFLNFEDVADAASR